MKINNVKNRILPLPEAVKQGLEREPKIQDFEILKELGSGSFGRVYLVTHKVTKVQYAIKAIDKRNKANIEESEYFKREIEIMYKIRHPNVVHLYGHFEDDKYIYFIMEYVSNGNLYNLIPKEKNKHLSQNEIANLMKGVISAVYFLHNMNPPIIHRDIKPENVLIAEGKIAKLTDFGWSNYGNEVRDTVCGTPIYLAPEIINEQGHDEKVDIWCIGVLLFELCTGSVPFQGNDIDTLKSNIRHMKISWPKDISIEAKNLISKILKFEPKERLSLQNIMNHGFFSKEIPNVQQYLIKPDENMPHKPFIISKDNPKDEPSLFKGNNTESTEENLDDNYEKLKASYDNLFREYNELKRCGGDDRRIKEEIKTAMTQKEEMKKDLERIKEVVGEKDKKIVSLLKATTTLDNQKTSEEEEETELQMKVNQLEEENSSLKDKCEEYEKFLNEKQTNPNLEKKINQLRQTLTDNNNEKFKMEIDALKNEMDEESRKHFIMMLNEKDKEIIRIREEHTIQIEKERKRFAGIINKYEVALEKLTKDNKELKSKNK